MNPTLSAAVRSSPLVTFLLGAALGLPLDRAGAAGVAVDLEGYSPNSGVMVTKGDDPEGPRVTLEWPVQGGESGRLVLDTRPGKPLIESMALVPKAGDSKANALPLLANVDPVYFLTVGTRQSPPDRPPSMSVFNVFFDSPALRPHKAYRAKLDLKRVRVVSPGRRASVILGELSAGPFRGELHLTVYPGARLVHVEAVVQTQEDQRAYLYDTGLVTDSPSWRRMAWKDTEGQDQRQDVDPKGPDKAVAVRHRTIVAESDAGAVACFPPPHSYFFPRDLTDNLRFTWYGKGHRELEDRFGFGVRQWEKGGGNFSPWYNAPPGSLQRLGVFYLLSKGSAKEAIEEVLRFTHGDRFPALPGHLTFTSHWHMATAIAALNEQAQGKGRTTPDLVNIFKDFNVNIVHLAEFHGDGHPGDPGPLRLPELDAMFAECRRLSDADLLFLPGEEANVHLNVRRPGANPGHWLYLFPKPVHWVMKRGPNEPFVSDDPRYGKVYRVGNRDDMVRLLEIERGLAWTAHPRIKASNWAPDIYRHEDFYKSDRWLGGAWKAMPADLAQPRLGTRVLDLLDDMANWGERKYVPGEVDVFKIDHTHELYGHMNVNYLRLDKLPSFDGGWRPVLDALRDGGFFVTTGEVLLREFTVNGRASGATVHAPGGPHVIRADLEWTFPLRFLEVVSGDGSGVYRQRIDLADTEPFGHRVLTLHPHLPGRRWVRVEAWDVAGNGTFSQPVWLRKAP